MKRALSRTAIALIALGAVFAAHAGMRTEEDDKPPKPLPPQQKNFPLDQTWSLRELNGKPVASTLDVSLKIDSALRGSGFTGCNSWSATMYPVKDQHLLVGPYALTKKQCDKDTMAIEVRLPVGADGAAVAGISSTANSSSRGRAARCGWFARCNPTAGGGAYSAASAATIVAGPPTCGVSAMRRLWKAARVERWPIDTSVVSGSVRAMAR